jgi:DNA-binding NarL/FixJ family response regulator
MPAASLRILIADDHALFRAGLRALLKETPGVRVIAEVGSGDDAVALAQEHRPDIVIMDISMKGLNGLDATARIKASTPATRVIILSMHDTEDYVAQALRAGASAYLLKDSAEPELDLALRAVVRDEVYLSPRVSKPVVNAYVRRDTSSTLPALTVRQREILQLIAEGHSTKWIAEKLAISIKTIDAHRAQIMERLQIRDVPGLVRYAIRNGLVSLDK